MADARALKTERLTLRPSSPEDLALVEELWTDADVRRFLFDDRVLSLDEARGFLERGEDSFRRERYGLWLFTERTSATLVGFAGLLPSKDGDPSLVFGTRPDLWGRGYAREAAAAVLRYAFDLLELPRVLADVDEANGASIRVLEKLGMRRTGRGMANGRPLLH
ncbi:MAG: GNAT family N-acetyltransferase, partial [Vicinamibacteria bacterium]